jgi:uncharacterized protein
MARERPPLEEMTLRQLRRVASSYGVSRYSRMRKSQLLDSIQVIERERGIAGSSTSLEVQESVEASKFDLGIQSSVEAAPGQRVGVTAAMAAAAGAVVGAVAKAAKTLTMGDLADVDAELPELPGGYGSSCIMMLPRDPQYAYIYWDVPNEQRTIMRQQGGQQLALRIYDVTDINLETQAPHSLMEYPCDEMARDYYLPVPVSDRDYMAEIGYRTFDGRWLSLTRSPAIHMPPVYPSDWVEDHFVTVSWEEELRGKTVATLVPPAKKRAIAESTIYSKIFSMAEGAEAMRMAGSLFGSMQHVAGSIPPGSAQMLAGAGIDTLSSFIFPSGVGMWAGAGVPNASGLTGFGAPNMSGVGMLGAGMSVAGMSGVGMMSGAGMSGAGLMGGFTASGAGIAASEAPPRPRKFWLVADAELIVYGATEPDATVTVDGQPVQLSADGTFRFQMSFQDGQLKFPIVAIASDGEQSREITMDFERETPTRRTNTKAEAVLEWFA